MKLIIISRDHKKKNVRTLKDIKLPALNTYLDSDLCNFISSSHLLKTHDIYDLDQIKNNTLRIIMHSNNYDLKVFLTEFKDAYKNIWSVMGIKELYDHINDRFLRCDFLRFDNTFNKKELDHLHNILVEYTKDKNYKPDYIKK